MKKHFLKQIPKYFYVLLAMFLVLAVEAVFSIQMMKTVDYVQSPDQGAFVDSCLRLLLMAILIFPSSLLLTFCKGLYRKGSVVYLKKYYLQGLFEKDLRAFHVGRSGDYISSLTNDMHLIESNYVEGLYALIYGACSFLVGVGVIAYVSPYILIGGVAFGVLMAVASTLVSKPLKKQQEERSAFLSEYTAFIKEMLSAFHIIKVNALDDKIKEDFYHKSKSIQDKGYVIDKMYTLVSAFQNFLGSAIMIGLIVFAIFLSVKGQVTFGGIILVVMNLEKIMRPLSEIGEWMPKILSSKALFNKLDAVLEKENEEEEQVGIAHFENVIEMNNISYAYDEKRVLENANLRLEKGKKYLLVGPSGGGKSTLLKLLRKYLAPTEGQIRIDGQPLRDIKRTDYYKLIANIEQHVFLFEDTLRNNLSLYKPYSDEELIKALDKAGLSDFLKTHSGGLDYLILENGKNISGGEKSRIAIARGLLQNAEIIYLDEAFSSLDPDVSREIEETILGLKGITVVNVSHVIFEDSKPMYDAIIKVHGHVMVSDVLKA